MKSLSLRYIRTYLRLLPLLIFETAAFFYLRYFSLALAPPLQQNFFFMNIDFKIELKLVYYLKYIYTVK